MHFFPIFCSLCLIFDFFPHSLQIFLSFFWKYPYFWLKSSGSFRILKTTHKTGLWKDKDFSKKYTPMVDREPRDTLTHCVSLLQTKFIVSWKLLNKQSLVTVSPPPPSTMMINSKVPQNFGFHTGSWRHQ